MCPVLRMYNCWRLERGMVRAVRERKMSMKKKVFRPILSQCTKALVGKAVYTLKSDRKIYRKSKEEKIQSLLRFLMRAVNNVQSETSNSTFIETDKGIIGAELSINNYIYSLYSEYDNLVNGKTESGLYPSCFSDCMFIDKQSKEFVRNSIRTHLSPSEFQLLKTIHGHNKMALPIPDFFIRDNSLPDKPVFFVNVGFHPYDIFYKDIFNLTYFKESVEYLSTKKKDTLQDNYFNSLFYVFIYVGNDLKVELKKSATSVKNKLCNRLKSSPDIICINKISDDNVVCYTLGELLREIVGEEKALHVPSISKDDIEIVAKKKDRSLILREQETKSLVEIANNSATCASEYPYLKHYAFERICSYRESDKEKYDIILEALKRIK